MTRYSFTALALVACFCLLAQDHPTCNSQRYRVDVFDNVKVTQGIEYSQAVTIGGDSVKLYMDIYEPEEDNATERPVLILAFGGSFINGSRGDLKTLCERFAQKGYVAVSIDYRLYDLPLIPLPTETEMQDVVVKAIKDMKAAIQFLDNDAKENNTYGVDMNWLYVGGVSSGSITASHTAMLDSTDVYSTAIQAAISNNAPVDGVSNTKATVPIRGVLNYSGALNNVAWIDAGDPPFISYHEDGDPTVPYKVGYAQIFGQNIIGLSGSFSMDSAAQVVGVPSVLNTINSSAHVGYFFDAEKTTQIIDESALFMYDMICSETASLEYIVPIDGVSVSPNPFSNTLNIAIESAEGGKLEIMDIHGKVVLESQLSIGRQAIETAKLSAGVYFLHLDIAGRRITEKLIKE